MMKTAICFLTVRPCELFYQFCKKLARPNKTVYICIDDDTWTIPNYDNEIPLIRIPKAKCEKAGFKGTVMYFKNSACSRDKALYYFTEVSNIQYDYIWFLEEDVFVPTEKTIDMIDTQYPSGDLLSPFNEITDTRSQNENRHWNSIRQLVNRQTEKKIEPPFATSMICAFRCSSKLLQEIKHYAEKHKMLFMDEAFFNTIALKNNLEVICPPELSTIVYRHEWTQDDIKETNLYHPVKSIDTQKLYRERGTPLRGYSSTHPPFRGGSNLRMISTTLVPLRPRT